MQGFPRQEPGIEKKGCYLMTRFPFLGGVLLIVILLTPGIPVQAAKVKVWQHYSQAHYEKAQFKQAVVNNEGTLRLSRQVKAFANLQAMHVWDIIEDKAGNLIVATGTEGKLFKISTDGKVDLLYSSRDSQILCLTQTPDGTI